MRLIFRAPFRRARDKPWRAPWWVPPGFAFPMVVFDGADDYLSRPTAITNAPDGSALTMFLRAFLAAPPEAGDSYTLWNAGEDGGAAPVCRISILDDAALDVIWAPVAPVMDTAVHYTSAAGAVAVGVSLRLQVVIDITRGAGERVRAWVNGSALALSPSVDAVASTVQPWNVDNPLNKTAFAADQTGPSAFSIERSKFKGHAGVFYLKFNAAHDDPEAFFPGLDIDPAEYPPGAHIRFGPYRAEKWNEGSNEGGSGDFFGFGSVRDLA